MSSVGLLYVGGVLFINALMLLGKIEGKSAAIFNIFIGLLQVFTPVYLIVSSGGNQQDILGASGIFLFGFTYLYVGLTNWFGLETNGLGWYCCWVAVLALGFSAVNFFQFSDVKFGIIWLFWSFLWYLFYLLLARKLDIAVYVGKVSFVMAWLTCTIPAFLSLAGLWSNVNNMTAILIAGLAILYFVFAYYTGRETLNVQKDAAL